MMRHLFSSASLLFLFASTSVLAAPSSERSLQFLEPLGAYVVREVDGGTACREATSEEALRINARHGVPLRVFGERNAVSANAGGGGAGLNIILRGTPQLEANPQAKAAFERAAAIWEARITNPITVYVDVDFGSTSFGSQFGENTIAQASSDYRAYETEYPQFRNLLVARADNAQEAGIYAKLPASSLPTDLGNTQIVFTPSMNLRAIGALPATAPASDTAPRISFNSAFAYDFDPSNGISPGTKDFEGVVVHEVGHMLGFVSTVGIAERTGFNVASVFDWFRFRPGVSNATFTTAPRQQSPGGDHVHFAGASTYQMSTADGNGEGGDGQQASHWKDDDVTGTLIGIMDPNLGSGVRAQLSTADLLAFGMMGYSISGSGTTPVTPVPSVPGNLTATLTSANVAALKWTDSTNETVYVVERRINNDGYVELGTVPANAVAVNVNNLQQGVTYTFRIKARNDAGDSAYSNEASVNTGGGTTGPCVTSANVVCLLSNRFRVSIDYINAFANPPQPGKFVGAKLLAGVQNPDVATFGISGPQAIEAVVRIQDARPFGINRFDIYYGGLTDLEYTVSVTDTQTGTTRTYRNAPGTVGGGVDRSSFSASRLPDDQLFSSGGSDSFPVGETLDRGGSSRSSLTKAAARLLYEAARNAGATWTVVEARQAGGIAANSGGAGACSESEPNETITNASTLPLGTPCTGSASIADIKNYEVDGDGIEDVFKFTLTSPGKVDATLTFTNGSADLDLYLFTGTLTVVGESVGVTKTERIQTDAQLPAGTYYLGISAFEGVSPYTLTVTATGSAAPPAVPTSLAATAISSTEIRLTWSDNATNETAYVVEARAGNSGFIQVIDPLPANTNSVTLGGATPGVTFTFRVKARNGTGDSGYSNESSATTSGGGAPSVCTTSSTVACLLNNRFRVSINFINQFANPPAPGAFIGAKLVAGVQNPDVATFGLSSAQAIEAVVRIQDARPFGVNRFDVYYGGLTDLEYTVSVTDTQTGNTKTFRNPPGTVGGGVDRVSFPAN